MVKRIINPDNNYWSEVDNQIIKKGLGPTDHRAETIKIQRKLKETIHYFTTTGASTRPSGPETITLPGEGETFLSV